MGGALLITQSRQQRAPKVASPLEKKSSPIPSQHLRLQHPNSDKRVRLESSGSDDAKMLLYFGHAPS